MPGKFHSRMAQFADDTERCLDAAILDLGTNGMTTSQVLAPKKTRALVKSHKITRKGLAHYRVTAGNSQVPYAAAQNIGYFTLKENVAVKFDNLVGADSDKDKGWRTITAGRHYFKKYTTKGTGKGYMTQAFEAERSRIGIYIRRHARRS